MSSRRSHGEWTGGPSNTHRSSQPAGVLHFSPAGTLWTAVRPEPTHRLRAQPHETAPLQMPITRPVVVCAPDQRARNGEPTPLLRFNNSPEGLTELRETRSLVYYLTKDVMDGTGEQQPSAGAGEGTGTPPPRRHLHMFTNPATPNPVAGGFGRRRHGGSLTPFPAPHVESSNVQPRLGLSGDQPRPGAAGVASYRPGNSRDRKSVV